MDSKFKAARLWLNETSRTELYNIIEECMLTERQKQIALMRRAGESNVAIALKLNCDVGTINNEIRRIYKIVSRVVL